MKKGDVPGSDMTILVRVSCLQTWVSSFSFVLFYWRARDLVFGRTKETKDDEPFQSDNRQSRTVVRYYSSDYTTNKHAMSNMKQGAREMGNGRRQDVRRKVSRRYMCAGDHLHR